MKNFSTVLNFNRSLIPASLIILVSLFITSCNSKRPAVGQEDQIIVIADSTDYYSLEGSLLTVFGKIIYTPQQEQLFNITRKNLSELNQYKTRKNIIIVAPLNSKSDVASYIDKILDPKVRSLVEQDSISVINKKDLWARDQLVMILTAPSMEKLNQDILAQSDNLLHFFQKMSDQRLVESLYNSLYEQKKIEATLLKEHGWLMYVQTDYGVARDDSTDNFVWLRRSPDTDLERWIFVHWIDNASPTLLNKDSVIAIRNRMTKKFYRTTDDKGYVKIDDYNLNTSEVNFQNRYALYTQGLWRMVDSVEPMGGPFVNYTFYDRPSKRLYMLDGSIYAPRFYKKKLIQQVDVLLQSFLTEKEVSPDKKEDLLDELK